ncbi:DUF3800 domain-containing protein [Clostridium perfringens]|uniref:DUF3800 domain-containing protein n=1 Tax=Clostridium perfringens TaxID=1502 RepID=UPI002245F26D|nr:DUF3800 domain-containing protein [Clostridium perfringens]MCX0360866.1 DUF3800 domain-containing protein [Clostridium perfringens]
MINVYCDESCHLENDNSNVMVIGGVWCSKENVRRISNKIKELKKLHGISSNTEIKWVKVSKNKENFYLDLINLFFDEDINFRAIVVPDKSKLRHRDFNQDHNTFYDKMYYFMLVNIIEYNNQYNIYVDIKDSYSNEKCKLLKSYISKKYHDDEGKIIQKIQPINSRESQLIQLADIFIGAITYCNRNINSNKSKLKVIDLIKEKSNLDLRHTTGYGIRKCNIFMWDPS